MREGERNDLYIYIHIERRRKGERAREGERKIERMRERWRGEKHKIDISIYT